MRRLFFGFLLLGLLSLAHGRPPDVEDDVPDVESGKLKLMLETGGHDATIVKLFFTADGRQLVSVSRDYTIRFWDVRSGEMVRALRTHAPIHAWGHGQAAALSSDRKTLVLNGKLHPATDKKRPLLFVNLTNGQMERVLRIGPTAGVVMSLALAPDGKTIVTGQPEGAFIWDAQTGNRLLAVERKKNQGPAVSVGFTSDGKRLAVLMAPSLVIVDPATGKSTTFPVDAHAQTLQWSPDDRRLALGHRGGTLILDASTGKTVQSYSSGETVALAWGMRGNVLLTGGAKSGTGAGARVSLFGTEKGRELRVLALPNPHSRLATAAALSPDGALVAAAVEPDQAIHLWRRSDGPLQRTLQGRGEPVVAAGWLPRGKGIAWGRPGQPAAGPAGKRTGLHQAFDFTRLAVTTEGAPFKGRRMQRKLDDLTLDLGDPSNPPRANPEKGKGPALNFPRGHAVSGTFLADGRVVLGTPHGLVHILDGRTGQYLTRLSGHRAPVYDMAPSPDNRFLLTASGDQTLKIWNIEKRGQERLLLTVFVADRDWIAWTPEGYYAASPAGERLMGWQVRNGPAQLDSFYPAERFRKRLLRPDVVRLVLETGSVAQALEKANAQAGRKEATLANVEEMLPPRVTMEVLGRNGAQVKVRVRAEAVVKSQPVKALRLLLGGRRFADDQFTRTLGPNDDPSVVWDVTVPPGKHELRAAVDGPDTSDVSEPITVHVEPPALQKPTLYSVAVGLNYTWDDRFQPYRLGAAEGDARSLHGALQRYCAGPGNHFGRVVGEPLVGKDAKKAALLDRLRGARKAGARPGDLLVLFFAGHGVAHNGAFYLLTADTDPNDIPGTALSGAQLCEALSAREMPCSVLLILDACQSGAAAKAFAARGLAPATDVAVPALASDETAVTVLAASRSDEYAGEQKGGGRLTRALIKGLAAGPGVGYDPYERVVYVHSLYTFAYAEVRNASEGKQSPVLLPPPNAPPLVIRRVPEQTSEGTP